MSQVPKDFHFRLTQYELYFLRFKMVSSVDDIFRSTNTTHITTYLLIMSRVVYIRYLGLIFPKASGKRATDLLDAWLHLW